MFVHDFVHIERKPQDVKAAVLAERGRWLLPLCTTLGGDLRVQVGPASAGTARQRFGKDVHVELGEPVEYGDTVVVPMRWEATGPSRLFPTLDANLEITSLGMDRTRIGLSGHYRVPLGAVGRKADDWLLHGLAEDTLRAFLQRVRIVLETDRQAAPAL